MTRPLAGLIASVGVALVITAASIHKNTSSVIDALAMGGSHLEEASLGYRV